MELKKELDEIKEEIEPINSDVKEDALMTFEDAKNQALQEFKPVYNKDKSMYENGKDIARTIGLNEALKDDEFLGEMKEGAKNELKTDMDTDQKYAEIRNQEAFYKKHMPVLLFAHMKEPSGLALMKWTYAFAVVPYMLSLLISGLFNLVAMIFSSLNDLFNAIVGRPEYYTNKNGDLVLDENKKPITKSVRVNLLTKILFWFIFVVCALLIVMAVIKWFTGFDVISGIRSLIS